MAATLWSTSNPPMLSEPSDRGKAGLTVVPWSMFGTSRLYVNTADGRPVGWIDLKTGHRTLAMPDLEPAFEIALSGGEGAPAQAEDSPTPRRALEAAIELALVTGHAALQPDDSQPAEHENAEEPADHMRRAFRGKQAYSSWDLGARGTRLVEDDLDRPVCQDPRWAYLNSMPVSD